MLLRLFTVYHLPFTAFALSAALFEMCDLFLLSAGKDYSAPKSLPLFAMRASKNMDGWGIGYFKK